MVVVSQYQLRALTFWTPRARLGTLAMLMTSLNDTTWTMVIMRMM